MEVDLLTEVRWILPIEPEGLVEQAVLICHQGKIVELLPWGRDRQICRAKRCVQLHGHALMLGRINAYTQTAMTLLRAATPTIYPCGVG